MDSIQKMIDETRGLLAKEPEYCWCQYCTRLNTTLDVLKAVSLVLKSPVLSAKDRT